MSKRKFYRNFNKRKKFNGTRVVTVILCLGIVGTYAYINLKDNDFMDKLASINMVSSIKNISIGDAFKNLFNKSDVITSSNIKSQLEEIENKDQENETSDNSKDNAKVASVNKLVIYTIQVASLEDNSDLKKIEEVMNEYKIPSSSMSIDNCEKIQVYSSFDENKVRINLQKTKTYFSDAFLTKIEVPMLSLQYTDGYAYMKDIADGLNNLIENYQKESEYWDQNKNDLQSYNEILTSRKTILESLKKNTQKINYSKMDKFKNNLISYIDECQNNILISSKNANENKGYVSEGLLLSSIQQYYVFVQSMK
ncbi:MAG: hypothetical protein PUJ51_11465 [Clostridiales bacterium]|uniref:hypothetical protein n=1 Tax=Terrisporobacter sp. TaxID=1965305 RepID=UPI002A3B6189|nr:hypothetical protein [Terrisporobacter sp.]MCI5629117.1 hypothetical protein [Clostridium sp.]MDD5877711.1 hypothetical protein [Clostridiales bacterium]MCI6459716.1 hypothetical protein [Clostridium sp.]MCI7207257.1 hypothetical protein [Clostridium sp.]MDD7755103.1 hypothetical protein [Clostridiales bacterium]